MDIKTLKIVERPLGSNLEPISNLDIIDAMSIEEISLDRQKLKPYLIYQTLFGFRCPYISYFASANWYLVWYCGVVLFQSMVINGFVIASITPLERRYKLSSKESSIIPAMYDFGSIIVVLPISFYGNKSHKPLWVGLGSFIMGVGCFIYASPQFLSGSYEFINSTRIILCHAKFQSNYTCDSKKIYTKLQNFKYLLYFGQLCLGIGSSPLFTLGLAHIEAINSKQTSSLHVGIATSVTCIGPSVGFALSGWLLQIYVDIDLPSKILTPDDTDIWIGAWWIGFIFAGVSLMIISLPLITFPRFTKEMFIRPRISNKTNFIITSDFSEIVQILQSLIRNFKFECISIALYFAMFSLSGLSTYAPKYMEIVFGLTSSSAMIIIGMIAVPTLACGALSGGIFLSQYNWKLHGSLIFMTITTLITVPFSSIFLLQCNKTRMAGVDALYFDSSALKPEGLNSPCNLHCKCSQDWYDFLPSCSVESLIYFNPCFAGCHSMANVNNLTRFSNCSCINTVNTTFQLTNITCQEKICWSFYLFLILLGMLLFLTYLKGSPSITATMRSVHQNEISMALGFQSITVRCFGSFPGYIIYGVLIDKTCLLWDNTCSEYGSCIKYDIDLLTKIFCMLTLILNFLTAICFMIPTSILTFMKID